MNKGKYTERWFDCVRYNFDRYQSHLKGKRNSFLEIGSFEGLSTNYFVDVYLTNAESRITCVDPWIKYSEAAVADMGVKWDGIINENTYNVFTSNTSHNSDKIIVRRGLSTEIVPALDNNSFDFVYIDGDHSESTVWLDAINSFD